MNGSDVNCSSARYRLLRPSSIPAATKPMGDVRAFGVLAIRGGCPGPTALVRLVDESGSVRVLPPRNVLVEARAVTTQLEGLLRAVRP